MSVKVLEVHLVGNGVSLDETLTKSAATATKAANEMEAAGRKISKTGKTITSAGKSWNRAITLPLLAVGAASVKMAFSFEKSMSLISTEAGGTRKEVDHLEKSVLSLAKASQWSPEQLASGLYHIESSGYRGAKAMGILNAAQKLATAGNSELEETTYALVSAVKALGAEGIGPTNKIAAEMNAIIGHGDMRLQEFVTSLSSGVLSTAKMAGLGLRDVGAAMDIMTARGEPAQIAATRLRMSISLMSAPTEKAQKALANINLRTLDLAHTMRKEGLGAAVKELAEHLSTLNKTKANQVLAEAFGGGRSSGAIKALVLNYDELLEKEKDIGKGVRNYSREVKEAEGRNMTKMKTAWATIQADLVEIGMVVGPPVLSMFEDISDTVDGVANSFSHLDSGTQGFIVKVGFAAIAMGPLLTIGGKLVSVYGKLFELSGAVAASGIAQDFKAAGALALEGEGMSGFAMAGGSAAKSFIGGVATKLGPLAAAAGLADIVYHAIRGEWKSVGFEVGGALIGGVIGFIAGGPAGAALGAGLGAFGGDIIKHLFGGDNKTKMQEQIVSAAHHVASAFSAQVSATEAVTQTQESYKTSAKRVKNALHDVEQAEKELARSRENNGKNSIAVIEAEEKVASKRHAATMRTREEIEEEESLRFLRQSQGASAAEVIHATAGEAIPTERKHIRHLHKLQEEEGFTPELGEKQAEAAKRLARYLKEENDAYKLLEKTEPARAARLKEMTGLQQKYGESGATLKKRLHGLREEEKEAETPVSFGSGGEGVKIRKVVPSSGKFLSQVQNEAKRTQALLGHLHFTAPKLTSSNALLGGVQRELTRELHRIDQQFNRSGPEWGQATVHAMKTSVNAIRRGMKEGVVEAGQGKREINKLMTEIHLAGGNDPLKLAKGFRESWRGAGEINVTSISKIEKQLNLMPKSSQEAAAKAMMGMAKAMQQKGKLPEAQVQNLRAALQRLSPGYSKLSQNVKQYKQHQDDSGRSTDKGTEKLKKFGGSAETAGHKVQSAKTEVVTGFATMEAKGTSFLSALNVPSPFTAGTSAPKKAGGGLMQVQGHGLQDTVPLYQRDVAAMVAPGEMLAVINRHQAPLMSQALHNEYGVDGLHGFFNNFDTPHYMAIGGVMEPSIGSGGGFRGGGQKEMHTGFQALVKYLKAHAEPERITNALHAMEIQAHKGYPYVYGGGHGSFSGPFDCSGFVSYGLHAADFIDTPMSVAQGTGLYTLGESGPGKYLTWGVRGSSGMNAHTMMSIKDLGKGWKFFESGGSGGGAHEDSGWDGSFQLRHMPGFARGGIPNLKLHGPAMFTHEGPGTFSAAARYHTPFAKPAPWQTRLSKNEEGEFRSWLGRTGTQFNPNAAQVDYDMRGYYQTMKQRNKLPTGVLSYYPDAWKTPLDVGWSRWSKYAKQGTPLDWINESTGEGVLVNTRSGQIVLDHRHAPVGRTRSGYDIYSADKSIGRARGGIVPIPAREAVKKYGKSAMDPKSPHFVGWGFNRGGVATGTGSRRIPNRAAGGWVNTGYTIYSGSGAGAGGDLQTGAPGYAELGTATTSGQATGHGYIAQALGMSGELPMGFALDVRVGGKEETLYKKDRGYGQGTPEYSIDIHERAWKDLGLSSSNGKGHADIKATSGQAGSGSAEKIPGVFHGAHTKTLNFPSMPKTLGGVKREIRRWGAEVKKYRRAAKAAKGRTKTQRAIEANIVKIEKWLRELHKERIKLREEEVKKHFKHKLKKAFGSIAGFDAKIEGHQKDYEEAEQFAQQLVALEPQSPPVPEQKKGESESAYEALRESIEKSYEKTYTDYVEGRERPAFERILNIESNLRNTILSGENVAAHLEQNWEARVRTSIHEIEHTERVTDKTGDDVAKWRKKHGKKEFPKWLKDEVAERDKLQLNLPMVKFRKHELEDTVNSGREAFFPGRKDPISPPNVPAAGTGSFEDSLIAVQGIHWPNQHSKIDKLPATPVAGNFGGTIWDTQMAIRELGLKIAEVGAGSGGGGNESSTEDQTAAEKLALVEEMQERERHERAAQDANSAVMASLNNVGPRQLAVSYPWAGRYAKGGPVAAVFGENGPEIGIVPEGTNVATAERTQAMLQPQVSVTNHHYPTHTETEVELNGEKLDAVVNEVSHTLGGRANHRAQTASNGKVGTLG